MRRTPLSVMAGLVPAIHAAPRSLHLKVFTTNDFTPHYPVGGAAVVIAENQAVARELLDAELRKRGLTFDGTLVELALDREAAVVLLSGDY